MGNHDLGGRCMCWGGVEDRKPSLLTLYRYFKLTDCEWLFFPSIFQIQKYVNINVKWRHSLVLSLITRPKFILGHSHLLNWSEIRHLLWLLKKLIDLFVAALGLHCCMRAFSSCGEQGLLFVVACGLLIAVASLVAEHGL